MLDGPDAFVSMYTDSSDLQMSKPKGREEQLRHYAHKNRKYAYRYAIAVSPTTGDLCWVSSGHPAATADIKINEEAGLHERIAFFERIGAEGAYKARRRPEYITPIRKPTHRELTQEEKKKNNEFASGRVIVENVFSRVKQFSSMESRWRQRREAHPAAAKFVFNLVQVIVTHTHTDAHIHQFRP